MDTLQPFLFWTFAGVTGLCALATVVSQNIVRSATWLLFTLCGTAGIFFLLAADFVAATQLLVYVGGTLVLVVFGVMLTAQGPFIHMKTGAAEWAVSAVVGVLLLSVLVVSIFDRSAQDRRRKEKADAAAAGAADKQERLVPVPEPKQDLKKGKAPKAVQKKAPGPAGPVVQKEAPEPVAPVVRKEGEKPREVGPARSPFSNSIGLGFLGVGVGPAHEGRGKQSGQYVRTSYLLPFEIVSVHLLVVLVGAAYLARAKRRRVEA
jgi:NADH-quinone oxidoreductase subunit J